MRAIKRHIVHCSDTPNDMLVTVHDIKDWHVNDNGWSDVGYHFIINRDGSIDLGRPINIVGAHCKGFNSDSIGTCMIGRDWFTVEQLKTLRALDTSLRLLIPEIEETKGHTDYNPYKTCPNINIEKVLNV